MFQDKSSAEVEVVEIVEESAKTATAKTVMEEAYQIIKSVTGADEATAKKVLDETGGDTTRAINRLLDSEAEMEVKEVRFFQNVDGNTLILVSGDCGC